MIHNITKHLVSGMACGVIAVFGANAKTGAPHTIVASPNYTDVSLSWQAPADSYELKWHDDYCYNGDAATPLDLQKPVKTYVASKFEAKDLKAYIGEKIEAITFYQYRPVVSATVMVYENGKVVAEQLADQSKFASNTPQKVVLPQSVEIKEDAEYMFAVCFEAGYNVDFVAVKDPSTAAAGKSDLMSTDGKTWVATGDGDYLITANLSNDADETPKGYNVYRNNIKVNDALLTGTSLNLTGEPAGKVTYKVSAVFASEEVMSHETELTLIDYATLLPAPTIKSATANELDVNLSWTHPLLGGNELTWSSKVSGAAIGGTATKDTKVWVRNQFDASDIVAFRGGKISAINFYFAEDVINGVTLWIMKDGKFVYSEEVSADAVSAINANAWTKFSLKTPVQLEDGHAYAYGLYVLHEPKAHPISCDNSDCVDVKGNSFSVSSAKTTFIESNPTWKTLKSGGIAGNWMMTADITGAQAAIATPSYNVYRDGVLIKSGVSDTSYDDSVDELGTYVYSIQSVSGDRVSIPIEKSVVVKLPAAYSAPLIEGAAFDGESKKFELVWNMDKEISHSGDAAYTAGFDEEMSLMWGAQFTAAELSAYKGYSINKLKFCIGEEIGDITIGVYTTKGVALSTVEIPAKTLTPAAAYTVKLTKPVEITGDEDLILAYSGTLPAGSNAIIMDKGPLVDGGAKVSLTNGLNWLNLSTLSSTYGNYNIYISAMASENVATQSNAPAKAVEIGSVPLAASMSVHAEAGLGIDASGEQTQIKAAARFTVPTVKEFNIYCNGEKVASTSKYEYAETIRRFASFDYYVTTVFTNGWESAPSEVVSFSNSVAQKAVAPYGLTGVKSGNDLSLEWQAPEKSTVLSYIPEGAQMKKLRMTGSTTLNSYCVVKFSVSELESSVGSNISHIQFGVGDTDVKSMSVIVMIGENIVYSQSVPVSTLVSGLNDIRLNEPFEIPANVEVGIGYLCQYASSENINPLGCFESSDNAGYGDLISSSGSVGYWSSLQTKLKANYCWWIKGILAKADELVPLKSAEKIGSRAGVSYNIYHDGILIDNVTGTSAIIKNAAQGSYCVTAVNGDEESGESNVVVFGSVTGIDDVCAETYNVKYDRVSETILVSEASAIEVYSSSGALVAGGNGESLSIANLAGGIYMVRVSNSGKTTVIRIVK